jgi:hypothetical protein
MAQRYRVKVVVKNHPVDSPDTRYVIQQRVLFLFWADYSDETVRKEWAYQTCEELNTPYEVIAKQRKSVTKSSDLRISRYERTYRRLSETT